MKKRDLPAPVFNFEVPDWVYHSYVSAIVKIKRDNFPPFDLEYLEWVEKNPLCLDLLFYRDGDENKVIGRILYPSGNQDKITSSAPITDQEMGSIKKFCDEMTVISSTTIYSTDGTGKNLWNQILKNPNIKVTIQKVIDLDD